jgi:VCBS repeat protein
MRDHHGAERASGVSRWPLVAGLFWTLTGLLVGHATAWGAPLFGEPRSYPVGTSPLALVTGEFNQAPGVDLATADESNTLTILSNLGNGVFDPERAGRIGVDERFTATGMASGSFNDDAVTDFVLSANDSDSFPDFNGSLVIYRSVDRVLFRYGRTAVTAGLFPTCVTAGDLTGDGLTDIASCGTDTDGSGLVSVLRRTSPTAFAPAVESFSVGTVIPNRLVAADVDADGRTDLLLIDTDGGAVYCMYGRTSGALFDAPVLVASINSPTAVIAAQLNNDGLPDVAITSRNGGRVMVLKQTNPRVFSTAVPYQVGINPADLASADFNGDHVLDLVVANAGSDSVSLLTGNGDATFNLAETVTVGAGPIAIAVADFNGDSKPDFATANQDDETFGQDIQSVSVVLNGVTPAFTPTPTPTPTKTVRRTSTPTPTPTPAGPGDKNCDGKVDQNDIRTMISRIFDGVSGCVSGAARAKDITLTIEQVLAPQ